MAYSLSTFLKSLSSTDKSLQIIDTTGVVKWTINPFTVKNTYIQGNIVKISLNSDREIILDFRTAIESKLAISKLQEQLEVLRNQKPQYIDKIIEEYIQGIGLSYSSGNLYLSANLIPAITGTYTIGNLDKEWKDLFVSTSSIYIGGVTLSSDGENILISNLNLSTDPNHPFILSSDGIGLLINGSSSNVGSTGPQGPEGPQGAQGPVFPVDVANNSIIYSSDGLTLTGTNSFIFDESSGVLSLGNLQLRDGEISGLAGVTFSDDTFQNTAYPGMKRQMTISAGKNDLTTNSYLKGAGGEFTNLTPYILPFDCTLMSISAASQTSSTWTAEVHKDNTLVTNAYLTITGTTYNHGDLSIDFSAGDNIMIYCNGTSVSSPLISLVFYEK